MDTDISSSICPACNAEYETIYYQRRAADEPPDKVVYCVNCPLNISKLSLSTPTQGTSINLNASENVVRKDLGTELNRSLLYSHKLTCIKVEGSAAQRCYKELLDNSIKLKPVIGLILPVSTSTSKKLVPLNLNCTFKGRAFAILSESRVAPFITLQNTEVFKEQMPTQNYSEKYIIGYEHRLKSITNVSDIVIRTIQGGTQPYILLTVDSNSSEKVYISILEQILIRYGTEINIKSFIDSSTISALYNQSARAFDWASAPKEGYMYTWKPDGERFWYLKYGSIWIFCRRLLSGKITGWNISKTLTKSTKAGPILDVEVMIGHPPILIDVLALESGTPTSALRSLDTVLSSFYSMKSIDVPIHVRKYFKSEADLIATKSELTYPIDGVVGIESGGMTIIKLKDVKSIELKLQNSGNLVSSEELEVLSSDLQLVYPVGSIIEVRFTRKSIKDEPEILETILRTDKTKANEYSVCQDIMRIVSTMPDNLARRRVLLWCNSVRQKIHQIAIKSEGKGRIILDIGAGDGQGVTDYSDSSEVTYILIEPDKNRCNKLRKRLSERGTGKHIYFSGSSQIGKAISSVSKGLVKYAIMCTSIEDVLKEDGCIKMFKNYIRYCTASFSISHTYTSLNELALQGFNVIGCGYFYDNINPGNFLINDNEVVMKRESESVATVKWGTDAKYHEPAITSDKFKNILFVRLASTLIPTIQDQDTPLLNKVSSAVYIVSSKKRI